jgi:CheY-like chemotaxis protein
MARDMAPGDYVKICVSDTGTGMPPELISRAFDPFFTTKPLGTGTGLGLSMVYGFVRQSGGQVRIQSVVGGGTSVCIDLPRAAAAAPPAGAPVRPAETQAAGSGTVLIVDDEPTLRDLVAESLTDRGYAVLSAADGPAAMRILQSAAQIDLLVTDVGLPGGMNGRQLADAARVARPALRVLFITGYAESTVLSHGDLPIGMAVLTKPFAMEALQEAIRASMI